MLAERSNKFGWKSSSMILYIQGVTSLFQRRDARERFYLTGLVDLAHIQ